MIHPSANKGEWSELYAIGYLLTRGGGYAADELTNLDPSVFYKVLQVVDDPTGYEETVYKLHKSDVEILKNGLLESRINKSLIEQRLSSFFQELSSQEKTSSFFLTSGAELMQLIRKEKLSASSAKSTDVHLILEDFETKIETPKKGFSIKSEIGSPATVFNASHSTNLTFKIDGKGKPPTFDRVSSVKGNIEELRRLGFKLSFQHFDSPTFAASLKTIDSNLPEYLSEVLLAYTHSGTTKMQKICNIAFPESDPDSQLKTQKIKKFLSAASMGLKAATVWSGYPEDFGGMLLVKRDGDVLFYHLYNMRKFEEYLFNNLRFETPSATRHGFGQVYQESGKYFIKLNLQIRY